MVHYALRLGVFVLLAGCVGDDNTTPKDGGTDATVDSPTTSDAAPDQQNIDAGPDVDKGPAIDGGFAFAAHWGTNSTLDGAESIAAIPTGGFVVGGNYTMANVVIGAYGLPTPTGSRDCYVATLDSGGKVTAAIGFGGSGADDVLSVAADASGDVYIAGLTFNGLTLNGQALGSGTFLAKLNGKNINAAPLWVKAFSLSISCPSCLVTHGSDLVYATTFGGLAGNTINFGSGTLTTHGGYDVALAKFDASTGTLVWSGQIGGAGDDTPQALAIDASRNFYILGNYTSATLQSGDALGSKVPTGPGTKYNLLVAKLDSSPTPVPQWAVAYGDPGGTSVNGQGIAVDATGHVAVAATFNGGIDFGMGATGSSSTDGIVWLMNDATQKTTWQQVIGDVGADRTSGVAFDAWGHIIVSGWYEDSPAIGADHLADSGASNYGAYLAKFGPPPTYGAEWGVGFPQLATSTASISSTSLAVAPSGVSATAGGYGGTTNFGAGNAVAISTSGTSESFVAGRLP